MHLPKRTYMNKKIISYLLIALFTAFMTAPTLSIMSKTIDSSIFYSLNEEDTSSNENLKVFRMHGIENAAVNAVVLYSENKDLNTSYLTLYTPYVTECISPPPESVL